MKLNDLQQQGGSSHLTPRQRSQGRAQGTILSIYNSRTSGGVTDDWWGMKGFLEIRDSLFLDSGAGDMSVFSF